jgi:hypothetical protein
MDIEGHASRRLLSDAPLLCCHASDPAAVGKRETRAAACVCRATAGGGGAAAAPK